MATRLGKALLLNQALGQMVTDVIVVGALIEGELDTLPGLL